jgi:hypothetical protein
MPFKSKAQQKWMFAAEARGEVPVGTARRWAHETPNIKSLPARKSMSPKRRKVLHAALSRKG